MTDLQQRIAAYVEANIGVFHQKRIESLDNLKLESILKRKNPYLYRVKNALTADGIVTALLGAHLSSNEETIFGNWLEGLAIEICRIQYGGQKSGIKGVDLEFSKDQTRYLVAIKSGPNWGNSSQIAKMRSDFTAAKKTLRTSGAAGNIVAVNGCCAGRDNQPDKGDYYKYCGQRFWEFISGDADLYTRLIDPLAANAKKRNDDFNAAYACAVNRFTLAFTQQFCMDSGAIDWPRLVRFNSAAQNM